MNIKADNKVTVITDTLKEYFGDRMNLARIKFFSLFISALCKVQTVCFEKIACGFESDVKTESSLRRIQRFISEYSLDRDLIARFLFALLPHEPPYRLALDRTNWKLGAKNINILTLGIVYKGVAFPMLFHIMPKFGNSSMQERIDLMNRFIRLFGAGNIECLLADREFVGDKWLEFLNISGIEYHIRIRGNFWVEMPRSGKKAKALWLFPNLKVNQCAYYRKIVRVNGELCYLSASRIINKEHIPELQIIVSFNKPNEAHTLYKDRWQIESAFKALKTSGFNIEDTHLTDIERISKLMSLVLIAFAWVYRAGIYLDTLKPIKIKKHGRRAKSIFKYGLVYVANLLFKVVYRILCK
ncbi:MAG: IS4 family transposase [Bacteroidales bacterium]|nr:IS4 family transposase [Bacteroidales bacterium]